MKRKNIFTAIALLFGLTIAGCNTANSPTTSVTPTTSTPTTSVAPSTSVTPSTSVAPSTTIAPSSSSQPDVADTRIVYAKNEAGWANMYIYTWIDNSTNKASWPGEVMEPVADTSDIFMMEVPLEYLYVIFNNGSGGVGTNQTKDLSYYNNVNIYTVAANTEVEYGYYEDGKITEVDVNIVVDSNYYYVGSETGWGFNDNSKLVLDAANDKATFTITVPKDAVFKISNKDWSSQFSAASENITLCDGLEDAGDENNNILVTKSGKYLVTINDVTKDTVNCVITVISHEEVGGNDQDPDQDVVVETRKIYVEIETGWENVYAYGWNDSTNDTWPGKLMTRINETNFYEVEINDEYKNIIFSNGSNAQTQDLTLSATSNAFIVRMVDSNIVSVPGVYLDNDIIEIEE